MSIENRYDFFYLLEAVNCNPNGDPDMGNSPRQDFETGRGIITDVAVKRRIRNYVLDASDENILMQSGTSINKEIAKTVAEVNNVQDFKTFKTNVKVDESAKRMCEKFWDVRAFGGVLTTGRNAGQIRGAVQLGMSTSYDAIYPEDITITRMCYTEGKDFKTIEEYEEEEKNRPDDKKRTMGEKHFIPYGLFPIRGSVSACVAEKNGFSDEDLNLLWESCLQAYAHDISSSKQGMSVVSPMIIFKHVGTQAKENDEQNKREAKLGCASLHSLYNLIHVKKKDDVEFPRSFDDYEFNIEFDKIPRGVVLGIKTAPFSEILWGDDARKEFEKCENCTGRH